MTDDERLSLKRADVQHLLDLVVGSLDYASGLLEDADVDFLREMAAWLGVDPRGVTPALFRHKYPHPYEPEPYPWRVEAACECGKPPEWPTHVPATNPRDLT